MSNDKVREMAEQVIKELAARGKVMEGGWQAFLLVSGLQDAPDMQKREMRKAYYLGAQHLFASIMTMLDPGSDPTDADVHGMDLIQDELKAFTDELRRNN